MRRLARIATVALMAFGPSLASAQEAGQPQITETKYTDWTVACAQAEGGSRFCEMSQSVEEGDRTLLRIIISPIGGTIEDAPELVALAQVYTPLGIIIPEGIVQQVDRKEQTASQLLYCLPGHCYSRFALTESDINDMKRGRNLNVTLQMFNEEEPNTVKVSLRGFRRAFEAL